MRKFALIGFPLSHSFSPSFFKTKFENEGITDCEYNAFPIQHIIEVQKLLDDKVEGFNVTIPYKQDIIEFLHDMDDCAREIGAVNCVTNINGKLTGYNTDEYGFRMSLLELIGPNFDGKAMVLGTGGAAKAVIYVLKKLEIPHIVVSRKQDYLNYEHLNTQIVAEHQLIINTTPLGMYPHNDKCPHIPFEGISENHYLYDLIYNPSETQFLQRGLSMGAKIKNGADMLILQAEKSWQIWNQQ